jgi:hypothetical protein
MLMWYHDIVDLVNILQLKKGLKIGFPRIGNSKGHVIQFQEKPDQFFADHITVVIETTESPRMNVIDGLLAKDQLHYTGNYQLPVKTALLGRMDVYHFYFPVCRQETGKLYKLSNEIQCFQKIIFKRPVACDKIKFFVQVLMYAYYSADTSPVIPVIGPHEQHMPGYRFRYHMPVTWLFL